MTNPIKIEIPVSDFVESLANYVSNKRSIMGPEESFKEFIDMYGTEELKEYAEDFVHELFNDFEGISEYSLAKRAAYRTFSKFLSKHIKEKFTEQEVCHSVLTGERLNVYIEIKNFTQFFNKESV